MDIDTERKGRGMILCPFRCVPANASWRMNPAPCLSIACVPARAVRIPAEIIRQTAPVAAGTAAGDTACKGENPLVRFKGPDIGQICYGGRPYLTEGRLQLF